MNKFVSAIVLTLWAVRAAAADPPKEAEGLVAEVRRNERLDAAFKLIREAVENAQVPGAIALVSHNGRIVRQEAFGFSDPDRQVPFRTNTLCWIASVTKPVTVASAMAAPGGLKSSRTQRPASLAFSSVNSATGRGVCGDFTGNSGGKCGRPLLPTQRTPAFGSVEPKAAAWVFEIPRAHFEKCAPPRPAARCLNPLNAAEFNWEIRC